MQKFFLKILKFEFEARIFISFIIVIFVSALSFSMFYHSPSNAIIIGKIIGSSAETSMAAGYLVVAFFMLLASILRSWSGSILTSQRMMSFRVQVDKLMTAGPYLLVRNPIYLADLIAFCGFALCLTPIGIFLPVLLLLHYTQLIKYEEVSLIEQFGKKYLDYKTRIPRLIPNYKSACNLISAFKEFEINRDGLRHNALYLLFIPGFILAAFTQEILFAVIVGIPAVFDWAIIHTKIGLSKKPKKGDSGKKYIFNADQENNKIFKEIIYAQCWEDPQIDREAFKITSDDVVFSITSGGCNTLTFLLDNPRKVIALDINPHQNFLLDLKIAAFKNLSYEELLEFTGLRESKRRLLLYKQIRSSLQVDSIRYWDNQLKKIKQGIIHCGRYEGYMRLLKTIIVTPIMKRQLIEKFFETEDSAARAKLFHQRWENIWWWLLTRIMLSRTVMTLFFDRAFFVYLDEKFSFGKHFAKKVERALTQLPMKENYFLSYILLRRFYSEEHLPVYLRQTNYDIIRSRVDRIEIVTDSCEHFFTTLSDSCISKFNFSNIFEWISTKAYENLLKETIRVAKDRAVITYRNLLVFREHPVSLDEKIHSLKPLVKFLHEQDLSFIYNNYVVEEIHKGEANDI
ncbi:MAG: DUF3419 family protein [Acidobacteriota bacterium]